MSARRFDVSGLIFGILFVLFAAGALFVAFGGSLGGPLLRVAIPLVLVAVGGLGVVLSRKNA